MRFDKFIVKGLVFVEVGISYFEGLFLEEGRGREGIGGFIIFGVCFFLNK